MAMQGRNFIVILLFAPTVLLAEATRRVEIVAQVPLVAQVDSPGEMDLSPGETRLVTIRVACNQPWLLSVQTDNPQVATSARHVGAAGGMSASGHTFTVSLTCAAGANGPQHAALVTRLMSGAIVAGLPH
jgi:hypothetical protein